MSYNDFERVTPIEFYYIYKAYTDSQTIKDRTSWEQTRILATMFVQPYSKSRITPTQLLPLPWDNKEKEQTTKLTKEQAIERFKKLLAKEKANNNKP